MTGLYWIFVLYTLGMVHSWLIFLSLVNLMEDCGMQVDKTAVNLSIFFWPLAAIYYLGMEIAERTSDKETDE